MRPLGAGPRPKCPGTSGPETQGRARGGQQPNQGGPRAAQGRCKKAFSRSTLKKPKRIDVVNTTPSGWRKLMINKYPELPHQSPTIFFYLCKDNRVISCFFSFQFLSPNSASHFLLQRMFVVAGRCHPPATIKRTFMMSCGLLPLIPLNKLLSLQPRGSQSCSARRLAVVLCCTKKLI